MLGIIGGSGLYQMPGLQGLQERQVSTPFGSPSGPLSLGKLNGREVAFLARHGKHHALLPSEVNYAANIWALKSVGVKQIISVSAVGSLSADLPPGTIAAVGQYIDHTRGKRRYSFFGEGLVAHVSTAEPTCRPLTEQMQRIGKALLPTFPAGKVYGCVEGPRFGTRAESHLLRQMGCHVVGMTNVPEAFLAREAQVCYLPLAVVTDFDSWQEDPEAHVDTETMLQVYARTLSSVQQLLMAAAPKLAPSADCACRHSLRGAILTKKEHWSDKNSAMVEVLLS